MNNIYTYSLVMIGAVFISSVSQILLKKSADKKYDSRVKEYLNLLVIIGYFLFLGCTFINVIALKYVPLSLAPILESTGYVFITVLSYIFLKEKTSKKKLLGIIIILIGVFIFAF